MFLQTYYFAVTLYGWYKWNAKDIKNRITETSIRSKILLALTILGGTLISGYLFKNIHLFLPKYFKIQAAYPFTDSFVMVSSILATVLLAKKKVETWYLWITVDIVCVALYFKKGV
jgi:nicotinamide mononucleotide transporter